MVLKKETFFLIFPKHFTMYTFKLKENGNSGILFRILTDFLYGRKKTLVLDE